MKLWLYFIGKPRDAHANGMAEEFIKRSSRYMDCEMREIQPARFDLFGRHASARKVFLDPAGKTMDSQRFAALLSEAELQARDLVFLIGGMTFGLWMGAREDFQLADAHATIAVRLRE